MIKIETVTVLISAAANPGCERERATGDGAAAPHAVTSHFKNQLHSQVSKLCPLVRFGRSCLGEAVCCDTD